MCSLSFYQILMLWRETPFEEWEKMEISFNQKNVRCDFCRGMAIEVY